MEKSACVKILEATEAAQEATARGEPTDIKLHFNGENDGKTATLMMRALQEDGIPSNVLRMIYANCRDTIKGILEHRLTHQAKKTKDISLAPAERQYLRREFLPGLMRVTLASLPTMEADRQALEQMTDSIGRAIQLFSSHPELIEVIFESARADVVVELSAEITREAVRSAMRPLSETQPN